MKVKVLIIVPVFAVAALFGCSDLDGEGDVIAVHYYSYQAASKSKAFDSGWLPKSLPKSAYDIVEAHNIDTNEVWVKFDYLENDIEELVGDCSYTQKVNYPDVKRVRGFPWWPRQLTSEYENSNLSLYFCPKIMHGQSMDKSSVAVDSKAHRAWYWINR
jgi:hypothetical protein